MKLITKITGASCKEATKFTKSSNINTLDISYLTRGVYFIYLQSEDLEWSKKY